MSKLNGDNIGDNYGKKSCSSTYTFTIIEAIKAERQRKINYNDDKSIVIDIAIIILSKTINYETKDGYFLVGDGSLECHECARLFFKVTGNVMDQLLNDIDRGDIIIANNVYVKKDYGLEIKDELSGDTNCSIQNCHMKVSPTQKLKTILCDFSCNDWRMPQPTQNDFFHRIAKIMPPNSFGHSYHIMEAAMKQNTTNQGSADIIVSERVVNYLLCWFQKCCHNNDNLINSSTTDQIDASNKCHCRVRRVRELKTPNVFSDIIVSVETVENSSFCNPFMKPKYNHTHITYAILSEGNGIHGEDDIIPFFYDYQKYNFYHQFQDAFKKKQLIRLSKILTQYKSSPMISNGSFQKRNYNFLDHFDYILVPTLESTIQIITSSSKNNMNDRMALSQAFFSQCSSSIGQFLIQNNSESFDESSPKCHGQVHSNLMKRDNKNNGNQYNVNASIVSIEMQDNVDNTVVLAAGVFRPNHSNLVKVLVDKINHSEASSSSTKYSYRSSTITLQLKCRLNEKKGQRLTVNADSNIMSILCGGFDPADLVENEGMNIKSELLSNCVEGFLSIDIYFEWTLLEKENGSISVKDVYFKSMEF